MDIHVVEKNICNTPKLMEIKPGTLVCYQNNIYIKVNKSKLGAGLDMHWPKGYSILFNPKYGSHRAVSAEVRVDVMAQCNDLDICRVTDRYDIVQYLRDDCSKNGTYHSRS